MCYKALLWACSKTELSPTQRVVLQGISNYCRAKDKVKRCFPSFKTLQAYCKISAPTLASAIEKLEEKQYIEVERIKKVGNYYSLVISEQDYLKFFSTSTKETLAEENKQSTKESLPAYLKNFSSSTKETLHNPREEPREEPSISKKQQKSGNKNATSRAKKKPTPIEFPDWMDEETRKLFNQFRDDRAERKKPMTQGSIKQNLGHLKSARDAGVDPKTVIQAALSQSWVGFYYWASVKSHEEKQRETSILDDRTGWD